MIDRSFKRPESVLVVVYTRDGQVLLLQRQEPPDFWQSVTGSLGWDEPAADAARRELHEETGLPAGDGLCDRGRCNRYPILPAWRARYAPDVQENIEHVFTLELAQPVAITLNAREHRSYRWLRREQALQLASSHTNRAAIVEYVPA